MAEVIESNSNFSQLNGKDFLDKPVQVYTTSITTTRHIRKKVMAVTDFLAAHGIEHQLIDMCFDLEARPRLLEIVPEEMKEDPEKILPPQIFAGDFDYCGSFDGFEEAKEIDKIYTFFRITPPEGSAEYRAAFPEPSEASVEEEPEEESEAEASEGEAEGSDAEAEDANEEEPKEYDPEVEMGQGNIEDTQMFAAVMSEQTEQKVQEQGQDVGEDGEEIIELSVQTSQKDEQEAEEDVESVTSAQSVIENN